MLCAKHLINANRKLTHSPIPLNLVFERVLRENATHG
jgi:hypothetical protein